MISTEECDGDVFGFLTAKKRSAALDTGVEEKLVIEVNHNAEDSPEPEPACNAEVCTTVSSSSFHLIITDRSSPVIFPVKVIVLL